MNQTSLEPPLVSALVSTYSAAEWLPTRLDNLLEQTLADRLQIVVINSGSPENENEIVRTYQRNHSNITYLRTQRENLPQAWNRGIELSTGKYLTHANTDDRLCSDALRQLVEKLEQRPDLALVYADGWETHSKKDVINWKETPTKHLVRRGEPLLRRLAARCICGPQPVWRRSLHEDYGLFDTSFEVAADWDFWLRIRVKEQFGYIPRPLGLYFHNPLGLEHGNQVVALAEAQRIRESFFQKR